jgi:hypothetical protein
MGYTVAAGDLFHTLQFLVGGGQGGFHAGDFTEPAFAVSLSDADREVVAEPTDTRYRNLTPEMVDSAGTAS